MANYYFLAPSLPPLTIGQKPDMEYSELAQLLAFNLTKEDFKKSVVIRRYIDLKNIRALLMEKPIDHRGNLGDKELDEALLHGMGLPDYVFDFLQKYSEEEDRIKNFAELIATYFSTESSRAQGFVKDYLNFEREIRLVLLGLRSKSLETDLAFELQFEDPSDPLVAHLLAQKDSEHYEPPTEYAELKALFVKPNLNPLQRYQLFLEYKFHKIAELIKHPLFSIDWILAYLAELTLIEHWNMLDEEKGQQIFERFAVI
jgi:Protein of unknown function (DUF2764)